MTQVEEPKSIGEGLRISEVSQTYETDIYDRENGRGVRFITVPARSLPEHELLLELPAMAEALGTEVLGEQVQVEDAPYAIAALLERPNDPAGVVELFNLARENSEFFARDHPELLAFAEYAANGGVIPFENSPVSAESLENLVSGPGMGVGAAIGFVIAGPTPLLLVTVPAGMIICGSAKGIAEGVAEGLRYHIRRLMRVPPTG